MYIFKCSNDVLNICYCANVRNQIACFLHCYTPTLALNFANVIKKNRACICGVYAIAFVNAISQGKILILIEFDPKICDHLVRCLEKTDYHRKKLKIKLKKVSQ